MLYENGVISENGMKIRRKIWFYSKIYLVTKTSAIDSLYKIFVILWFTSCKNLKSNNIVSVEIEVNSMQPVECAYNLILKGISNIYNALCEMCHIRNWHDDQMKNMVLQHCLFSYENWRYWLIILGFSCEMFWNFMWSNSCKYLKSNHIVYIIICFKSCFISEDW